MILLLAYYCNNFNPFMVDIYYKCLSNGLLYIFKGFFVV